MLFRSAKGFLTYECISFCQNYLSTENQDVGLPTRKHFDRLNGYGHREGASSTFVSMQGRKDDFERAHRVALQHLKLIETWVEQHKCSLEKYYSKLGRPRKKGDVTREHNSSFTRWFKQRQLDLAKSKTPSTEDENLIFSLSRGPGHNVRTYQIGRAHV